MMQALTEWGASVWAAIAPHLHDQTPIDLAISACFLITLATLALACLRRGSPRGDRVRWACVTALVAGLLVNQQTDVHTRALAAARTAFRGLAESIGPAMNLLQAAALLVGVAAVAITILASTAGDRPPGPIAGFGLVLLLGHATGRGATFLGLVDGPVSANRLHLLLEVTEVFGLLLIIVAAVRYKPPEREVAPQREQALVSV